MTLADELRAMLAKAQRYMTSAESLSRLGDYDSAVSRLYYSMFYCAEALLLGRGLTFSSHRAVISAFARHLTQPGLLPRELHQWLHEAFSQRQISDYEFVTGLDAASVAGLQAKARQFWQETETFLKREGLL